MVPPPSNASPPTNKTKPLRRGVANAPSNGTTATMTHRLALLLSLLPISVMANPLPPMLCRGDNPLWTLDLTGDTALFSFQRRSEMSIPHQTSAEGRDWPRVLTLLSRHDTAIVIIDERSCGAASYSAQVLTQRGQTPILLVGCCTAQP